MAVYRKKSKSEELHLGHCMTQAFFSCYANVNNSLEVRNNLKVSCNGCILAIQRQVLTDLTHLAPI